MTPSDYAKTIALLAFDGANDSTTFIDRSFRRGINTVTAYGNAKISTAQSVYGGSSGRFDGNGDTLRISPAPAPGTSGDFAIGARVRFDSLSGDHIIVSGSTSGCLMMHKRGNSFGFGIAGVTWGTEASNVITTADTWYDLLVARASGTLRGFVDGTQVFSVADTNNYLFGDYILINGYADGYQWAGYMDEFVAAVGTALGYTASHSVPGALTKTLSNASVDGVKDDTGATVVRTVRAYPLDPGQPMFETTSGSDGKFSLIVPDLGGQYIVQCLDDAAGTSHKDLIHRATPV